MLKRSFGARYWGFFSFGSTLILAACAGIADRETAESTGKTSAADQSATDPIPCAAWSDAVVANTGAMTLNARTLVDSYESSAGSYGGSNVGAGVVVQAAKAITNNGAVVRGVLHPNTPGGFNVIPVPANATKLPLGSSSPGSLNINTAKDSITLAPGNYVAANINVNFPGSIKISPPGPVRIWVTGNLNLGGNENLNGVPRNLAFLVNSSGFINVNSGGALYGMIYAPTSSISVNSPIFGSLVGSGVNFLNSGAALHHDQSSACSQTTTTTGGTGLDPLPKPPGQAGCYVGTLNGWLQVKCQDPKTILGKNFRSFDVSADGLATVPPVGTTLPLVYGQVESTVIAGAESDSAANGNLWGIQLNSNWFNCPSPVTGQCWDQFVISTDAVNGNTAVCIETWQNGTAAWNDQNFCVGADGTQETAGGSLDFQVNTRVGPLQAGDFANVAGYAYTSGGSALIGMVAQFSWVSSQDVQPTTETALPNRIPGLYAVVTPDQYGLANSWTNVAGGIMGAFNGTQSNFSNAEVVQRYAVSNCQDDTSAAGPTCPSQTALTSTDVQYQVDGTSAETNNLLLVPTPVVSFPNRNLAVTELVSSTTNAGSGNGACLAGLSNHLYMRDNEGDNGGVPSNVGGVPFWESPDIYVLPHGAPAPSATDTPADVALTGGAQYDVYLRVHNDFGCTSVPGPISVYIDAADPNLGFANWEGVTTNATAGLYDSYGSAGTTIVNAFSSSIIGPFAWTPGAGGHKCLLAAISGPNETAPTVSVSAPVLPPAYSSNQIAQRNVQIDSACSYDITNTNTTSANLQLGISMTPATPAPGASGGPGVSFIIGDVGGAWAALWNGTAGLSSVTNDGTNTTIVLSASYVALPVVPLAGGQSPSVQIIINPPASGILPTVNVSATLTDPEKGSILQQNGGSCTATTQVIPQ